MLQGLGLPTLRQRLVLFYKAVNKIACIQVGIILRPIDSRTRVNHRYARTNCESFRHTFGIVALEAQTMNNIQLNYHIRPHNWKHWCNIHSWVLPIINQNQKTTDSYVHPCMVSFCTLYEVYQVAWLLLLRSPHVNR